MAGNITFTMLKPGALNHEHIGPILTMINDAGFKIIAIKLLKLRRDEAENFYAIHNTKPFFNDLVNYMTEGPIVAMILQKENAVADYRKLMGATDPNKAEDGTLRKLFAEDIEHNAVHGSDSDENATNESNFFFSKRERFPDYPVIHDMKRNNK